MAISNIKTSFNIKTLEGGFLFSPSSVILYYSLPLRGE